jgi:2-polyprenyl-6-methoxyphenol hydroxylase-like FAD-dependent oxidoreductase
VEYVFGDSIRTLDADDDGVRVTFERGGPRTFGLVVGADGLHSNVRRLAFGAEARFSRGIGPTSMKTLIPRTPTQAWLTTQLMRLLPRLPAGLQRRLSSLQGGPARALEAIAITDYQRT